MKKVKIKNLSDYRELVRFLAVNAHNLLIDSYTPGEKAEQVSVFLKKCKEIASQLEKKNE